YPPKPLRQVRVGGERVGPGGVAQVLLPQSPRGPVGGALRVVVGKGVVRLPHQEVVLVRRVVGGARRVAHRQVDARVRRRGRGRLALLRGRLGVAGAFRWWLWLSPVLVTQPLDEEGDEDDGNHDEGDDRLLGLLVHRTSRSPSGGRKFPGGVGYGSVLFG